MKKTITLLALALFGFTKAQTVADFESFSLPADSYYYSATSADFQTTNAVFEYEYNSNWSMWSGGFAYTNKNNVDSGNYRHLYNCIAGKGYNNSNFYTTGQANGIIKLKTTTDNFVNGFYVTNTTYAFKSMKNGDSFAKKFGGVIGNDPDWFKLTVKGFSGGTMKTDSVVFYLADYRFSNNAQDYIVQGWQWVNCSALGVVDSVQFFMYSSDTGSFGMNTPAFFSIDNFTTSKTVGINEFSLINQVNLYPNPATDKLNLQVNAKTKLDADITIYNATGAIVKSLTSILEAGNSVLNFDLADLRTGLYFIEVSESANKQTFKFIKN